MVRIAPSILSADFLNLENDIKMMEMPELICFIWTLWTECLFRTSATAR